MVMVYLWMMEAMWAVLVQADHSQMIVDRPLHRLGVAVGQLVETT